MCRVAVREEAQEALAQLLTNLRDTLCAQTGADPNLTRIGPVDFGSEHDEPPPRHP